MTDLGGNTTFTTENGAVIILRLPKRKGDRMMLKIYLAEDQVMIAQALKTLLELEDDLKVIGTATDGKKL